MQPDQTPLVLPLQQHPCFAQAAARLGSRVTVQNDDTARFAVLSRKFGKFGHVRLISRGPVWKTDAAARLQTYEAIVACGVRIINAETPDDKNLKAVGFQQIYTPSSIAEIDLLRSDFRAAMHGKWRNRLRQAEAAKLITSTRPFDLKTDAWLLDQDRQQQREKRFRTYPISLTHAFADHGPDAMTLFTAADNTGPIAAMVWVNHAPAATYYIGWTGHAGRTKNAHNLMMSMAITHYAQAGYHRLDLGQVDTVNAAGLARFKIGAGATVRKLGGTWLRLGL